MTTQSLICVGRSASMHFFMVLSTLRVLVLLSSAVWYRTGGALKKQQLSLSFSGGGVRCSRGAFKNKQRNFKLGPRLQPAQTFLICSLCPFTIIEQHFPCRRIICQRYSTSFCAKIRVEDSVCCWHFKSLSFISPSLASSFISPSLASLRRNKCSLHASFIFHIVILHVKIQAVIKYNFAHSEPSLQTLPWKRTKRNLLFLEAKKFWFSNNKTKNFCKGICTSQSHIN